MDIHEPNHIMKKHLDEWNSVTGFVQKETSYYWELLSVMEDAAKEYSEQRCETRPHETIVKRPTEIKDRNGRMIFFGDTVRFVDKVEWYRGDYWAKVARGVMTREEALKEIQEKPYEERIVEDVQDYDWLLKSEIQTYWEVVDS